MKDGFKCPNMGPLFQFSFIVRGWALFNHIHTHSLGAIFITQKFEMGMEQFLFRNGRVKSEVENDLIDYRATFVNLHNWD